MGWAKCLYTKKKVINFCQMKLFVSALQLCHLVVYLKTLVTKKVYHVENSNSVRVSRPLLECIADENNKASFFATLLSIEREREFLKNKILNVKTGETVEIT